MFSSPDEVPKRVFRRISLLLVGLSLFPRPERFDIVQHFALPLLGQCVEGLQNFYFRIGHGSIRGW